jgi:hypothetical protein
MAFGLVFLDQDGGVWTVDVRPVPSQEGQRLLLFSRPSFVEPTEQHSLNEVPPCWPDCSGEELRSLLVAALDRSA